MIGLQSIILLFILAVVIYVILKKILVKGVVTHKQSTKGQDNLNAIPDACPHCKNPNTKGIRLCEWCGGQIA